MSSGFVTFLKLYGPIVLSLFFFLAILFTKRHNSKPEVVIKPLGDLIPMFEIKVPISRLTVTRFVLALASVLSLLSFLIIDFTSFFPSHLKMEVFFDEQGIRDSLTEFDGQELKSLSIPDDYVKYQRKYYQDLDDEIKRLLGISQFFYTKAGSIYSVGQTSFVVEKIQGIQKYHIVESQGELVHSLELPGQTAQQFKTFFEKLTTKGDYISPPLLLILLKHHIVLRPQFKQILAQDNKASGTVFHHTVVGVTKVTLFPWPDFSNTIYLADFKDQGLVPIAYAIYR